MSEERLPQEAKAQLDALPRGLLFLVSLYPEGVNQSQIEALVGLTYLHYVLYGATVLPSRQHHVLVMDGI